MPEELKPFATIEDLANLWRILKPSETTRAEYLLVVVSNTLRMEADKVGKNLDTMITVKPLWYADVVKSVTVDITARTLMTATEGDPMTQESQTALGYSWSATYLVPGGGLFIKKSELSRLGLRRQRIGGIELYGEISRNNNYPC